MSSCFLKKSGCFNKDVAREGPLPRMIQDFCCASGSFTLKDEKKIILKNEIQVLMKSLASRLLFV
jgi:hypothetical protein